jgi:hypothetical protein
MKTPYEKLKFLPNASQYLKPGVTFEQRDAQAARMSDHDAALALNNARRKLFQSISAAIRKQAWVKPARQNEEVFINPTESEQGSGTQILQSSFRLISGLENTISACGLTFLVVTVNRAVRQASVAKKNAKKKPDDDPSGSPIAGLC